MAAPTSFSPGRGSSGSSGVPSNEKAPGGDPFAAPSSSNLPPPPSLPSGMSSNALLAALPPALDAIHAASPPSGGSPSVTSFIGASRIPGQAPGIQNRTASATVSGSSSVRPLHTISPRSGSPGPSISSTSEARAQAATRVDSPLNRALKVDAAPLPSFLENTVDAIAIRRFFKAKAVNIEESQRDTVDIALYLLHEMGKSLMAYMAYWKGPKKRICDFEMQKGAFEQQVLPYIMSKVSKLEKIVDITLPTVNTVEVVAIRRFYEATAINMKETQRDTLDLALYFLHEMGKSLLAYCSDPRKGMGEFELHKLALEQQALPRIINRVYQQGKVAEIASPKKQVEMAFEADVERLLRERVFLNLQEPVNSEFNRRILVQVDDGAKKEEVKMATPGSKREDMVKKEDAPKTAGGSPRRNEKNEQILRQMRAIEKETRQLEYPGEPAGSIIDKIDRSFLQALGFDSPEVSPKQGSSSSDAAAEKMSNDYAYLACAYHLLESHPATILDLCRELSKSDLLTDGSQKQIVNDILGLVNKHIESPWATMNSNRMTVSREWIKKVHDMIKFRYLPVFEQGMLQHYRSLLVENMKCRPTQVLPFERLSLELLKKLLDVELPNPIDVTRAFKVEDSILCRVKGAEVKPVVNTSNGRYDAFLSTFGELFGQRDMFLFLDQQIAALIFGKADMRMEADYSTAYKRLWKLTEAEKSHLRANFEKRYGPGTFDKAFKYFKACQNVLGQGILYHFTLAVLMARREKFKMSTIGTTRIEANPSVKKNEFTIQVNGPRCEISIVRYDGLLNTEALMRQAYTIVFDVEQDRIIPPSKDKIAMSIECPSYLAAENREIKTLLFDLPLVMESLNFPPLKINYLTTPTRA